MPKDAKDAKKSRGSGCKRRVTKGGDDESKPAVMRTDKSVEENLKAEEFETL